MSTCVAPTDGSSNWQCTPNSIVNDGDAAWMLTSTAIVYMMTPGVGFFYGGMVSCAHPTLPISSPSLPSLPHPLLPPASLPPSVLLSPPLSPVPSACAVGQVGNKNVINTIFMSVICMGIVTFQWNLVGYSWAFSATANKVWGSFDWAALRFDPNYPANCANLGDSPSLGDLTACFNAATYPLSIHSAFQCAFAVITPAIISGSIIGRMKFVPYCLFILLWSSICYDGLACWVWNYNGWLHTLGALDFAGGTVVHISSATAGLTACIILGKRHEWKHGNVQKPPNVPFIVLGASLLWVGWMGFNAGSALAANGLAGTALVNTNGAAASAMMTWVFIDALRGHVSVAGACSGIVVGLVAITPACGFVHPGYGLLIGIIATLVVYPSQLVWKRWMRVDDTLDVFTCHGMGGITGAFCTGLFADAHWNSGTVNDLPIEGAFFSHGTQLGYQMAAIVTALAWSASTTAIILGILHVVFGGLRPTREQEMQGLDQAAHGESWEVASQMETLLVAFTAKDRQVNGEKHSMDNGTLSLDYHPRTAENGDKPVHVELAVHSPRQDPTQHLVNLERQSSSNEPSLGTTGYEYSSPIKGGPEVKPGY